MKNKILIGLIMIFVMIASFLIMPRGIQANGSAIIVMEQSSGRVLHEVNAHSQVLIASTVKVVTAIIAIESGLLYDLVVIDDYVLKSYGSGVYVKPGEELLLIDLVYGLMLRSGNDAALAIARKVSGSEEAFAKLMNNFAASIGAKNSVFVNPHGLDNTNQNRVTAHDLALIYRYAMKNEVFREINATKQYKLTTNKNNYLWNNKNKLLKQFEYTTGGKTGYTEKSGKSLISSAKKNDMELIVVTINNGGHYTTHKSLYNQFFSSHTIETIVDKANFEVPEDKYYDELVVRENIYFPLSADEKKDIRTRVTLEKNGKPGKVGIISVYFKEKQVGKTDIYYRKSR